MCNQIGATELPPKEQPDVPIGASNLKSKELLDEWNKKFPETIPGANQLLDQNALVQLLDTHHQTPEQIVELMELYRSKQEHRILHSPAQSNSPLQPRATGHSRLSN